MLQRSKKWQFNYLHFAFDWLWKNTPRGPIGSLDLLLLPDSQDSKIQADLGVRRRQTLAAVDSDQGVLLHRDVELEEARLLQIQLRAPEHPRRDALADSLADVDLPRVDGVVLLVEHAALPCGGGNMEGFHTKQTGEDEALQCQSTAAVPCVPTHSRFYQYLVLFISFFYCNLNATRK